MSAEQEEAVKAAVNLLTDEQKEQVARRQDKIVLPKETDNKPGASHSKGKTVDPREWGNVGIDHRELDLELQAAILETYEKTLKKTKKGNKRTSKNIAREYSDDESVTGKNASVPSVPRHQSVTATNRIAESRPATQIIPNSSLGIALGNVARVSKDPGDPSDTSSEYESSVYSTATSARSYSTSESRSKHRNRRHHRRSKSKRRSKRKLRRRSKSRSSIQPIPPKDYDGSADSRAYHRFVMEGEAYLRDGKVHRERQIRVLAHHLDGKAYDFYMRKVATDDPAKWNIHKFFTELFNYCFPIDYRQQMRIKLEDVHQKHHQTVSEFVYELQELFSMVGNTPPEMKVVKLWYNLKAPIQRALWRDGLHPDTSTWDEVVARAEIFEVAENVLRPSERRSQFHNSRDHDNAGNKNKPRNTTPSSRSMAYTTKDHDEARLRPHNQRGSGPLHRQHGLVRSTSRGPLGNRNATPRSGGSSISNPAKKEVS